MKHRKAYIKHNDQYLLVDHDPVLNLSNQSLKALRSKANVDPQHAIRSWNSIDEAENYLYLNYNEDEREHYMIVTYD